MNHLISVKTAVIHSDVEQISARAKGSDSVESSVVGMEDGEIRSVLSMCTVVDQSEVLRVVEQVDRESDFKIAVCEDFELGELSLKDWRLVLVNCDVERPVYNFWTQVVIGPKIESEGCCVLHTWSDTDNRVGGSMVENPTGS